MPGRVGTWVPVFKSLLWLDPEKFPWRRPESNPRSAALKADALTTGPTRWFSLAEKMCAELLPQVFQPFFEVSVHCICFRHLRHCTSERWAMKRWVHGDRCCTGAPSWPSVSSSPSALWQSSVQPCGGRPPSALEALCIWSSSWCGSCSHSTITSWPCSKGRGLFHLAGSR